MLPPLLRKAQLKRIYNHQNYLIRIYKNKPSGKLLLPEGLFLLKLITLV